MSPVTHSILEPVYYDCSLHVKTVFTQGHCAYLAEKLYNKLESKGWKIALIMYDITDDGELFTQPTHAVVVSPCGEFFLDINGLQRISDEIPGWYGDYLYYPSCYLEFFFETCDWNYFSEKGLDQPHSQYVTNRARLLLKAVGLYEKGDSQ